MHWYHYALLFYWAVSGAWLCLEHPDKDVTWIHVFLGFALGWVFLPAVLIERALR